MKCFSVSDFSQLKGEVSVKERGSCVIKGSPRVMKWTVEKVLENSCLSLFNVQTLDVKM